MVLWRAHRYADGDRIEVAGAPVVLRVSARATRVSLKLDSARRVVVATAPNERRLREAALFAVERAEWVRARLAALPEPSTIAPGAIIDILGFPHQLISAPGRAKWRPASTDQPAALIVSGEGEAFARAVVRALKAEARRVLTERTEVHAKALSRPTPSVAIMDARARWGSCTPPRTRGFGASAEVGAVRYSWRLMLAPFAVMDYVAAHECAHLIEANHSPRFWAVVKTLIGDHRPYRDWLKAHGARLHGFGKG
jgi:predicted metal-dependent hydrolase